MNELDQLIEEAYTLFSGNKPGEYLDACTHCCMTAEEAQAIKSISLRAIPRELLKEYQDAAKPEKLDVSELKYFAPRYLEFVKDYQFPSFEPLLSFNRFGYLKQADWTKEERELLARYALLFFKNYLSSSDSGVPPIDILLLFYFGKFDLAPLLKEWENSTTPESLLHFSHLFNDIAITASKGYKVTDAFSDDKFSALINNWLETSNVKKIFRTRIEDAIMNPSAIFTDADLEELNWKYELLV